MNNEVERYRLSLEKAERERLDRDLSDKQTPGHGCAKEARREALERNGRSFRSARFIRRTLQGMTLADSRAPLAKEDP